MPDYKGRGWFSKEFKDAGKIRQAIVEKLESEPLAKIDYVEVVDWNTLEPVENAEGPVLVAIAAYIGKTRLIDNFIRDRRNK